MFKLSSGTMYITKENGDVIEFGGISEGIEFEEDDCKAVFPISLNQPQELSFSLQLTNNSIVSLYDAFLGLEKSICDLCPNKKVVNLYKYAKKNRVRKKNRARMIRILEKWGDKNEEG